jgi:hypothetical protein
MKMLSSPVWAFLLMTAFISIISFEIDAGERTDDDVERILNLHRELIESHLNYDAEGVLAAEPEQITVVSRGEVHFPSKTERSVQYRRYLKNAEFSEYRDLIAPIVKVSADGTLGWLITRVKITGTLSDGGEKTVPIDAVWAWIELYEKRDGRWFRVGEVSNVMPPEKGQEENAGGIDRLVD